MLTVSGAVTGLGIDAAVASHYGDPLRESRTLGEQVGIVDRSHRGVIVVSGADRLSWLHSLISQHVAALPDRRGTEGLVLSPHGHVEHHLQLAHIDGAVWIDVEPGTAPALLEFLSSMRFMLRVELTDRTAEYGILSVVGPRTSAALTALGIGDVYDVTPLPDLPGWVRRVPGPGADAADICALIADFPTLIDRLGVPLSGLRAYDTIRVESRLARLGFETDHRTLAPEVGWLDTAVHLEKGCYRGQETVARVHNLGRPPRRMVLLHLDGTTETLPVTGSDVMLDGRRVGFVGTAVHHHELGPVALALVRRSVDDQAELRVLVDDEPMAARIDVD